MCWAPGRPGDATERDVLEECVHVGLKCWAPGLGLHADPAAQQQAPLLFFGDKMEPEQRRGRPGSTPRKQQGGEGSEV